MEKVPLMKIVHPRERSQSRHGQHIPAWPRGGQASWSTEVL